MKSVLLIIPLLLLSSLFQHDAFAQSKMYWIDAGTDKIQRADLDGSNVEDLLSRADGILSPEGIALDLAGGKIYWTDFGYDNIQRADLDGSNIEELVTGIPNALEIDLDTVNGKMYWTDSSTKKIQRADLDGSNVEDIVSTGLTFPIGIALDVPGEKIYWVDAGTDKIQRSDLDGSNMEDLVTTGLDFPVGLDLDLQAGKIYWVDCGTDKIQRANFDGSNVEDLVTTGLICTVGIALNATEGKMYWTDELGSKIQRADLDGSNVEDLITTGLIHPDFIEIAFAVPPIPARIGGTVTIDKTPLTDSTDEGYVVKVTKTNGDPFNPVAEDNDGLNNFDWYIIDIPIYDATEQPGGAQPSDQAVIHVYRNGEELTVTKPVNGEFIIGNSGSTEQIDIEAEGSPDVETNNPPAVPQLVYPSNGLSDLGTTIEFKWDKCSDPDGDNVTYNLYVCEDISFTTGCINTENIASLNRNVFYSSTGAGLLLVGLFIAGGLRNKGKIAMLVTMIIIVAIISISCGSTSSDPPPPTPNNEITQSVSGLKQGTAYYWKVVVDDNNDGTVESEVRSFTTQ